MEKKGRRGQGQLLYFIATSDKRWTKQSVVPDNRNLFFQQACYTLQCSVHFNSLLLESTSCFWFDAIIIIIMYKLKKRCTIMILPSSKRIYSFCKTLKYTVVQNLQKCVVFHTLSPFTPADKNEQLHAKYMSTFGG